jgi:ankyrin repeat protein
MRHVWLVLIWLLAINPPCLSLAGELVVSEEIQYPEDYTAPQMSVGAGGAAIVGPTPRDFRPRDIGTRVEMEPAITQPSTSKSAITQAEIAWFKAVSLNQKDSVEEMLKAGMPVDTRNAAGSSALMVAVGNRLPDLARLLIEKKAMINAADHKGVTPLMLAAHAGLPEVVNLLLEHGAALEQRDLHHQTALMYAVAKSHEEIVKILLEQGANPEAENQFGASPRSIAEKNADHQIVALLGSVDARANREKAFFQLDPVEPGNPPSR